MRVGRMGRRQHGRKRPVDSSARTSSGLQHLRRRLGPLVAAVSRAMWCGRRLLGHARRVVDGRACGLSSTRSGRAPRGASAGWPAAGRSGRRSSPARARRGRRQGAAGQQRRAASCTAARRPCPVIGPRPDRRRGAAPRHCTEGIAPDADGGFVRVCSTGFPCAPACGAPPQQLRSAAKRHRLVARLQQRLQPVLAARSVLSRIDCPCAGAPRYESSSRRTERLRVSGRICVMQRAQHGVRSIAAAAATRTLARSDVRQDGLDALVVRGQRVRDLLQVRRVRLLQRW
jgi:hypothetical protein